MPNSLSHPSKTAPHTQTLWFVWFFLSVGAISFFIFLFIGGSSALPDNTTSEPLTIMRIYENETIQLSGMLVLTTPCDTIDIQTKHTTKNSILVMLSTNTSNTCENNQTPRTFTARVLGDTHTKISFEKDGEVLPVIFIEK